MLRAAWPVLVSGLVRPACQVELAALAALTALTALLTVTGCAEAPHGPLAGASDAWETAHDGEAPKPRATAAPVWEVYSEVQQWPAINPAPFTSRGHQPEQSVDIRVNEAARASYTGLVTDTVFPEGSVLAELPRGMGHGYAMRKAGGVWSYFELDAQGRLLASGTPLALCAACHSEAPADHVFGSPRSP